MTDTTPSLIGAVNQAGTEDALFLKVFSGEVLTAFEERNVMRDVVTMRTIASGKSAQFPATGRVSAAFHDQGENILDPSNNLIQTLNHNEVVVNLDDLLVTALFVDSLDEMKNHYDVRQEYARQMGFALAKYLDERLLRVAVLAARDTTARVADASFPTGESIVDADFSTNGSSAVATCFQIAQKFDEKDVPDDGERYIVVDPATYYLLAQQTDLVNRDFGGMNGVFSDGTIMKVAGLKILKSNHIPSTNFSADAGEGDDSSADFTNTTAIAFHRSAVGLLKLKDIAMESEHKIEYQGTLMVGSMAIGSKHLRNEAAIEVASS